MQPGYGCAAFHEPALRNALTSGPFRDDPNPWMNASAICDLSASKSLTRSPVYVPKSSAQLSTPGELSTAMEPISGPPMSLIRQHSSTTFSLAGEGY